jgi:hypothetical protein
MASKDDDRDPQDEDVDEYGKTTMMVSPFYQKPEAKPPADVPVEEQRTQIGRVEDVPAPPSRVTVQPQQPQARQPQQQQRSTRPEPRDEPMELPRSREQTGRPQAIQRQPEKKPPIALFIAAGILLLGGGVGLGVLLMSSSDKSADNAASNAANTNTTTQALPPTPVPSAVAIPTPVPAQPSAPPTPAAPTPSTQAEPGALQPPTAASSPAIPPPKAPEPVVQQKAPEPTEPEEKVVAAKPEPKSKAGKKPSAKADKGSVVVVQGPDDEDQPAPSAKAKKKARLVIKAPPGVQVQIDNKPFGMTPLASPIELDAGQCFVTLIAPDGRKKGYAVELEGGETQTLSETF